MPCVKEGGADLCSFSFFVWLFCNYRKRIVHTATTIHTFWSVNWALFLLILTEITCSLNSLTLFWSWEKTPAASCPFGTDSFRVSQIAVSSWFTGLWPCLSETCLLLIIWAAWSSELKNTEKQTQKSNLRTYSLQPTEWITQNDTYRQTWDGLLFSAQCPWESLKLHRGSAAPSADHSSPAGGCPYRLGGEEQTKQMWVQRLDTVLFGFFRSD